MLSALVLRPELSEAEAQGALAMAADELARHGAKQWRAPGGRAGGDHPGLAEEVARHKGLRVLMASLAARAQRMSAGQAQETLDALVGLAQHGPFALAGAWQRAGVAWACCCFISRVCSPFFIFPVITRIH
jgi:hypothetical protein